VEILTTLEREAVRTPEAVHLAFPLAVDSPTVRYDLAVGLCRAEADQAPGGNRNHLTVATYADVSGPDFGVTLACPDAPLIEVGALRADPVVTGWTERLEPSATLYAYVMNNYWETNYRAEQPGPVTLRHVLWPHGRFDAVAARRRGQEARRPLHAIPVGPDRRPLRPPVHPTGEGLEILRLRPMPDGRWLLVLHSVAETPLTVGWVDRPAAIRECDLDGRPGRPVAGEVVLPPHGLRPLLVDPCGTVRKSPAGREFPDG